MRRRVLFLRSGDGEAETVVVETRESCVRIVREGGAEELDAARLSDGRFSLLREDGRQLCGRGRKNRPGSVDVVRGGRAVSVPIAPTRRGSAHLAQSPAEGLEEVCALMHGRIVEVRVAAGDRVGEGDLLLVLEAMKMQNEIRASRAGVVERAAVSAGQTVEGGEFMLSIRSDRN